MGRLPKEPLRALTPEVGGSGAATPRPIVRLNQLAHWVLTYGADDSYRFMFTLTRIAIAAMIDFG
jgi:hypothetical protein